MMKTADLSTGERLLLGRRRRNESQRAAARRMRVTLHQYRGWERDQVPCKPLPIGRVRPHEVCFLMRYRGGLSSSEVADALGVSTEWLCQMEYGRQPCDRLLEYWGLAARA